jgi:phosphoribosyl 1,2-cyclic phosphodiesterase
MRFCALASGSSGNCFYVNNGDSSIIVDAGISCRRIFERLNLLGEDTSKIKGVFITHEHSDHIKGADVFARKFNVPIFATKGTIDNSFLCSDPRLVNEIKGGETIKLGGMDVEAFSKPHKAEEPVSFSIRNGKMISILTDIGHASKEVIDAVKESDALVLESNHDLKMLEEGPYPYFLKSWIKSDIGHLSNLQSGLCVMEYGDSKLKNIMLAHLSEANNTPLLAYSTFSSLIGERTDLHPKIDISTRGLGNMIRI